MVEFNVKELFDISTVFPKDSAYYHSPTISEAIQP
jgi:hypothetical protein